MSSRKVQWICPYCGLGPGNDHRMCICRGFNYSVAAWEEACGIRSPNPESDSESDKEQEENQNQITGEQIKAELCRILNTLSPISVLTDESSLELYEMLKNYKPTK